MSVTVELDQMLPGELVNVMLRPGMAWVLYWDDGPSGPCGQSMRITCDHAKLHMFESEADMRAAVAAGIGRNKKARVMCGVIGEWTAPGVMSLVVHGPKPKGGAE